MRAALESTADLLPDTLIVVANFQRVSSTERETDLQRVVQHVIDRWKGRTTAHVFWFNFPGQPSFTGRSAFYDPRIPPHGLPLFQVPDELSDLATRTGGTVKRLTSQNHFWGTGPEVEVSWVWQYGGYDAEHLTARGPIVYADADVFYVRVPPSEGRDVVHHCVPRESIEHLRILEPIPAGGLTKELSALLPAGSLR